ncbi:ornithine carbamoyltransferase [Lactococcus hodotermopsidis]|uniref:Ornithine carbamoyltransferase n=1 Tax=Pseudolactococcus hodotermopsidis TaxID=2709157 RepID=A0A6A0BB17_9LACT|nr:ornithine carbamoyltransferase [Lactococcus hodotermopsidis]GFH42542.1 ornithine carbamoyltransferase [Lactococcus hodotermopsidis]
MFQGKSFLKEIDFTKDELVYLIDFAIHLKKLKQAKISHQYLAGKNIALLFEKTSTRTRAAFTVAANDLGAQPEFLGQNDVQFGKKESTADTAKVLGAMFDGIQFRGFKQNDVESLAQNAGVPVWNGLTDTWHPTQMLADFMTIKEVFGDYVGKNLVYIGDGRNNMANSLLVTSAILGVNVTIIAPNDLQPELEIQKIAHEKATLTGAVLTITDDTSAVKGADVIYTDVWVSMGEEDKYDERVQKLLPYQVNAALFAKTENENCIFMHCLPAFHDLNTRTMAEIHEKYDLTELEVTDEIFKSVKSVVFQEAENRLHTIKAVMAATLGNLFIPKV